MKAVVINATARTVSVVEGKWDLADLQKAVGGYIESMPLHRDVPVTCVLMVNEEGLMNGTNPGFNAPGFALSKMLMGNGVVCGLDAEGELTDVEDGTLELLVDMVGFFNRKTITQQQANMVLHGFADTYRSGWEAWAMRVRSVDGWDAFNAGHEAHDAEGM